MVEDRVFDKTGYVLLKARATHRVVVFGSSGRWSPSVHLYTSSFHHRSLVFVVDLRRLLTDGRTGPVFVVVQPHISSHSSSSETAGVLHSILCNNFLNTAIFLKRTCRFRLSIKV